MITLKMAVAHYCAWYLFVGISMLVTDNLEGRQDFKKLITVSFAASIPTLLIHWAVL